MVLSWLRTMFENLGGVQMFSAAVAGLRGNLGRCVCHSLVWLSHSFSKERSSLVIPISRHVRLSWRLLSAVQSYTQSASAVTRPMPNSPIDAGHSRRLSDDSMPRSLPRFITRRIVAMHVCQLQLEAGVRQKLATNSDAGLKRRKHTYIHKQPAIKARSSIDIAIIQIHTLVFLSQ